MECKFSCRRQVTIVGKEVMQTDQFRNLESLIFDNGEVEEDVKLESKLVS